jgi:hypothetical protein
MKPVSLRAGIAGASLGVWMATVHLNRHPDASRDLVRLSRAFS